MPGFTVTVGAGVYRSGMLHTALVIVGDAVVVAETVREIGTDTDTVRVYLGDALSLSLSPAIADQLADALADREAVISWPRR